MCWHSAAVVSMAKPGWLGAPDLFWFCCVLTEKKEQKHRTLAAEGIHWTATNTMLSSIVNWRICWARSKYVLEEEHVASRYWTRPRKKTYFFDKVSRHNFILFFGKNCLFSKEKMTFLNEVSQVGRLASTATSFVLLHELLPPCPLGLRTSQRILCPLGRVGSVWKLCKQCSHEVLLSKGFRKKELIRWQISDMKSKVLRPDDKLLLLHLGNHGEASSGLRCWTMLNCPGAKAYSSQRDLPFPFKGLLQCQGPEIRANNRKNRWKQEGKSIKSNVLRCLVEKKHLFDSSSSWGLARQAGYLRGLLPKARSTGSPGWEWLAVWERNGWHLEEAKCSKWIGGRCFMLRRFARSYRALEALMPTSRSGARRKGPKHWNECWIEMTVFNAVCIVSNRYK